jgi:hypothetical protein
MARRLYRFLFTNQWGGAGRDLIHGIYSEDAWWLYQQLKTRDPHISPTGATW